MGLLRLEWKRCAVAVKDEAARCRLCGQYISRWCDYLDCPYTKGSDKTGKLTTEAVISIRNDTTTLGVKL